MIGRGVISLSKGVTKRAVTRASYSSVVTNSNLGASVTSKNDKNNNNTGTQAMRSMSNYHPLGQVPSMSFSASFLSYFELSVFTNLPFFVFPYVAQGHSRQ